MEKIKNWLNEHKSLIIGLLIAVLMFKNCNSCTQERRYEYAIDQYEYTLDSMQVVIDERSVDTKDLCDTIHALRSENTILKDIIRDIKADREYYRKQNRDLANVAENLSKRDTIK